MGASGAFLRHSNVTAEGGEMRLKSTKNLEVKAGPYASAEEACNACESSYAKSGSPPAGPVNEMCVCMSFQDSEGWVMFCSSAPSAAGFVGEQEGGCTCK